MKPKLLFGKNISWKILIVPKRFFGNEKSPNNKRFNRFDGISIALEALETSKEIVLLKNFGQPRPNFIEF